MKSIPVISTAVVNKDTSWIERLYNSIDYPVDNFFIVNNNGKGEIDAQLDKLKTGNNTNIKKVSVTHLPANIGVAGAWNLTIKCYMLSPYWLIVNDDIAFCPGFLEEMATTAENNPKAGIIHGHPGNPYGIGSWDLFLIKDFVIQEYGIFDENTYPAYCEDTDYIQRVINKPLQRILQLKSKYIHGTGSNDDYLDNGGQTKKSNPELKEKLGKVQWENTKYLTRKWTDNWRWCTPTEVPFITEGKKISECTYDLGFVRSKHLGF